MPVPMRVGPVMTPGLTPRLSVVSLTSSRQAHECCLRIARLSGRLPYAGRHQHGWGLSLPDIGSCACSIPMRVGSAYDYAESVSMPYIAKWGDLAQTELVVDQGPHKAVSAALLRSIH